MVASRIREGVYVSRVMTLTIQPTPPVSAFYWLAEILQRGPGDTFVQLCGNTTTHTSTYTHTSLRGEVDIWIFCECDESFASSSLPGRDCFYLRASVFIFLHIIREHPGEPFASGSVRLPVDSPPPLFILYVQALGNRA